MASNDKIELLTNIFKSTIRLLYQQILDLIKNAAKFTQIPHEKKPHSTMFFWLHQTVNTFC